MKTLLSRSVSLVLALCMVVTMVTCAFTFVSAESTRLDDWQGFVTTELSLNSYSAEDGQYLKISNADLYVGDSIKWNGGWLNGDFTYADGDSTVSAKINGRATWYCDDTKMFESYLYYGSIASARGDNTPQSLSKAGTWVCKANLSTGKTINLVSFDVKAMPRLYGDNIFTGNTEIKYYGALDLADNALSYVTFSENEFYVGDTLSNGISRWYNSNNANQRYCYASSDGNTYTGTIWHMFVVKPNGSSSDCNVSTGAACTQTLDTAGTWSLKARIERRKDLSGNDVSGSEDVVVATFDVKAVPRMYKDPDGNVNYNGAIDVSVYQNEGVPFSTDDLYVGDKLVNGSGWWTNTNIPFTYDGASYTGRITWLTITDPNGNVASGYHVYNGGAIDYVCKTAGEYTLSGKLESVKDADGNSHSNIEPVTLRTFTVKACPHNYSLTDTIEATCTAKGYSVYTCSYCDITKNADYVNAKGHTLTFENGVVSCADCDYTKEYTGEAETISYKSADRTGLTAYTTMPAAAFVGDTIKKDGDGWWNANLPFTIYDEEGNAYSGSSYHAWIMFGDTEKKYFKPGNGQNGEFTFDEEGTYTLVGQIETGDNALGNVKTVLATIQVFNPVKYNVTVIGKNGNEIVTAVNAGAEIALADIAPFTYGYKVVSWAYADGTAIDTETIKVTADITLVPTFAVDTTKKYTLAVTGAKEDVSGQYNYNDKVTVKFDSSTLDTGKYFGGWQNGDGNIISYKTDYTFFMGADLTLSPIIVVNAVDLTPVVNITDVCDVNGDGSKISVMMERSVPNSGFTYVSSGFIYSTNEITDPTDANLRKSVATCTALNAQYRLTINLKVANEVNILAFCTYKDADGVEHTIYSNNGVAVHCAKNA